MRRRRVARERALGAAGEAVLQARRCCDHPQLTAYWRTLAADLQLGQARSGRTCLPRVSATCASSCGAWHGVGQALL